MSFLTPIFTLLITSALSRSCTHRDYPFLIKIKTSSSLQTTCSGSLLSSRWLLTAAHCMYSAENVAQFLIEACDGLHEIDAVIISSDYDPKTVQNDVALILLSTEAICAKYASIIADDYQLEQCESVRIIGWLENYQRKIRYNSGEEVKSLPRCLDVAKFSTEICKGLFQLEFDDSMICTSADAIGGQPCNGDSGGPLICADVIIGLVSFGLNCSLSQQPSVFSNVAKFTQFLNESLNYYKFYFKKDHSNRILRIESSSNSNMNYQHAILIVKIIIITLVFYY